MKLSSKSGTSMAASQSRFFDKSCLKSNNLFRMSLDDIRREVDKIHSDLLSSSYFRQLGYETASDNGISTSESSSETSSTISGFTTMSSTVRFDFRRPNYQEETKYIKEAQPFGNPFKMIIRPKNQNIQMSEIEDEAFMTNLEKKKKSNRLASYANLYKQQLTNQLKKYGEWFRQHRTTEQLDEKIAQMIEKRPEELKMLKKREEEIKKKAFQSGEPSSADQIKAMTRKQSEEDRMNYLHGLSTIQAEESQDLDSVAPLPAALGQFKGSQLFFDDLMELSSKLRDFQTTMIGGEEQTSKSIANKHLKMLVHKYRELFESIFVAKRFEAFLEEQFGLTLM